MKTTLVEKLEKREKGVDFQGPRALFVKIVLFQQPHHVTFHITDFGLKKDLGNALANFPIPNSHLNILQRTISLVVFLQHRKDGGCFEDCPKSFVFS